MARTLGLPEELARAALGYGGYRGTPGLVDEALVALLEEALFRGAIFGLFRRSLPPLAATSASS